MSTCKALDEKEWIRSLTQAQKIAANIPERNVTHEPPAAEGSTLVDSKKVYPIRKGEYIRKYISG